MDLFSSEKENPQKEIKDTRTLNAQQQSAIDLITQGKNIFLTGCAGTGKSFLLEKIVLSLQERKVKYAVTAATGIAGIHIQGTTLHTWAGIGLGDKDVDLLIRNIRKYKRAGRGSAYLRWTTTSVLIVDEISMIHPNLFDKLDLIAKNLRESEKPFGGMQLILSGDFLQLPPIRKDNEPKTYLFLSPTWMETVESIVLLQRVYRQNDDVFLELLAAARKGELEDRHLSLLQSKIVHETPESKDGLFAPLLHSHRKVVENENTRKLQALEGTEVVIERSVLHVQMKQRGNNKFEQTQVISKADPYTQQVARGLCSGMQAPQRLSLKVNCPVMMIHNVSVDTGMVNGIRGYVVGFGPDKETEEQEEMQKHKDEVWVQFEHKEKAVLVEKYTWKACLVDAEMNKPSNLWSEFVAVKQLPLALAYAMTIHKSQGSTMTAAHISCGKEVFEDGQAYVALSRLKNLDHLTFSKVTKASFQSDAITIQYYKLIDEANTKPEKEDKNQKEIKEIDGFPPLQPSTE